MHQRHNYCYMHDVRMRVVRRTSVVPECAQCTTRTGVRCDNVCIRNLYDTTCTGPAPNNCMNCSRSTALQTAAKTACASYGLRAIRTSIFWRTGRRPLTRSFPAVNMTFFNL